MKFSELITIDLKTEIKSIIANANDSVLSQFVALWNLECLPYKELNLLVESEAARDAYKAIACRSFLDNKANLALWLDLENYFQTSEFKRITKTDDKRVIEQANQGTNETTLNEGYKGYSTQNQANNFRQDTTNARASGTANSTDIFTHSNTRNEPEIAIQTLQAKISISIWNNVKKFIQDYCEVII